MANSEGLEMENTPETTAVIAAVGVTDNRSIPLDRLARENTQAMGDAVPSGRLAIAAFGSSI